MHKNITDQVNDRKNNSIPLI